MGRELRRVKKGWEHPKSNNGGYAPIMDMSFEEAIETWIEEYQDWLKDEDDEKYSLEDSIGSPPQIQYYRPHWEEGEATWVQVYENVSEGSPITPAFETKDELVDWMTNNKDFWGYQWTKEQAEHFMETEWSISGVMIGGVMKRGYEVI